MCIRDSIQAGIGLLISLIQALPQIIMTIVRAIPDIISGIVNAGINNIPLILQAGIDLLEMCIRDRWRTIHRSWDDFVLSARWNEWLNEMLI